MKLKSKSALTLLGTALLITGCSHTQRDAAGPLYSGPSSALPPLFLNGPAALLLTNAAPFECKVYVDAGPTNGSLEAIQGTLFSREGKLVFAADPGSAHEKKGKDPGISFIWDVTKGNGYVLCEALQAWAPVSTGSRYTNVFFEPETASPQLLDGHPCHQEQASVFGSEGGASVFHVFRASDLKNLPLKIVTQSNSSPLTLTLSKIRFEAPSDLFAPPDAFTRFSSPEAMMTELMARQFNYRRRRPGDYGQGSMIQ